MRYLSLCAIVRDEAKYIEEWIKYHAGIGVEHFYLYENDSRDNTSELIRYLALTYEITSFCVSGAPIQLDVYRHCLNNYHNDSRWIGFIDADEFIVPNVFLRDWLVKYEKFSGVAAHWYLFGSNGYKSYSPEPVVERFTRRQKDVNPHFKCFINPKLTTEPFTPHRFRHSAGLLVDENETPIGPEQLLDYKGTTNTIQINHYATKSLEECNQRRLTARADTGQKRNIDEFFKTHDRNEVVDLKAYDIWRRLNVGS